MTDEKRLQIGVSLRLTSTLKVQRRPQLTRNPDTVIIPKPELCVASFLAFHHRIPRMEAI